MKPSLSTTIVKQINITDINANDNDSDDESMPMQIQEPLSINMNGFNEINVERLSRQPTMLEKIQEDIEDDEDEDEDEEFDIDDEEMDSFDIGLPPLPTFNQFHDRFNHNKERDNNMPPIPKLTHAHSFHFSNYRNHRTKQNNDNNRKPFLNSRYGRNDTMEKENIHKLSHRNNRLPRMHKDKASASSTNPLPTLQLRSCVSAPILSAVHTSFHSGRSIKMDDQTANSARKYYEMIVNADSPYPRKKSLIYDDLVIGTKTELDMSKSELGNKKVSFDIKYKIGVDTQSIKTASGCVLTCGRYTENDIYTGEIDQAVSRIQFFILVIDNSLIILDGWSFMGTKVLSVNDKTSGLQIKSSSPDQRYVLRFNKSEGYIYDWDKILI
eukprot:CAMPEP_0201571712 /NCGR_PEP_ID=MMETSP0190_2-20130828/14615_1 /ASSEMBLY_ACC=CAM_ASM_000263 /TAXON_ID=37353 /ORGANISM="Rosalina sp." /LENGTH=382 /DNA_ID=CAMNT_0047996651 /DNA_START=69 /DNA_END=1218 /DNA_ORIENTATION=-